MDGLLYSANKHLQEQCTPRRLATSHPSNFTAVREASPRPLLRHPPQRLLPRPRFLARPRRRAELRSCASVCVINIEDYELLVVG